MKITDQYVFFWDGVYSNWFPCTFNVDGKVFNCTEQYMMYMKAFTFGDYETAEQIMKSKSPKVQKELGRQVKGFDPSAWDMICKGIVFIGCVAKFDQNPFLKTQLLKDGENRRFVEASPYDKIWGIGMSETDIGIEDPKNWKGKNYLGLVLDDVYNSLKEI